MGEGSRPAPPATPELDKVSRARKEGHSVDIGTFLEWLQEQGLHLCSYSEIGERWQPDGLGIQRRLADYFKIDLVKVEQERRALLDHIRKSQEGPR